MSVDALSIPAEIVLMTARPIPTKAFKKFHLVSLQGLSTYTSLSYASASRVQIEAVKTDRELTPLPNKVISLTFVPFVRNLMFRTSSLDTSIRAEFGQV